MQGQISVDGQTGRDVSSGMPFTFPEEGAMDAVAEKAPDYWVPKEFAAVVRLSEKSIYRLMRDDATFPHVRINGSLRIPRARALRWLAKRTSGK
jgi:predicted DNA-binding transcriptional regulator AlpA